MRVYIDSCVLMLAAAAAEEDVSQKAMEELNRDDVEYLFSSIVELEVIPQPTINKRKEELEFYRAFFDAAERLSCGQAEQRDALDLRCSVPGLSLPDALHVTTAAAGRADELVTAEKPEKPLPRVAESGLAMSIRTIRIS